MAEKDVATALDILVPAAQYRGSLTPNTQRAYDQIKWQDQRAKPAWSAIQTEMDVPVPIEPDRFPPVSQNQILDGLNEVRAYLSAKEKG